MASYCRALRERFTRPPGCEPAHRQFDDGHPEPTPDAFAIVTDPGKHARYTSRRSGPIRGNHTFQADASLLKPYEITERLETQFGVEALNLLNHNYFGRDQVNQDPNSAAFGSVFPAQVSTQNILPRQIQIRMKIMW